MALDRQALLWSGGFGVLALAIVVCAAATSGRERLNLGIAPRLTIAPISARTRLTWTALAFVPSSLLLGVTTQITTDVTSAPLLWVLPLGLYLLTFILVFARRPPLRQAIMIRLLPFLLIPIVVLALLGYALPAIPQLMLHLGSFFAIAMICHCELARQRPPALQLTEFYLFLSLGGVAGGAFNALLAPLIFSGVWEYPLALAAGCLLRPPPPNDTSPGRSALNILFPVALSAVLTGVVLQVPRRLFNHGVSPLVVTAIVSIGLIAVAIILLNFSTRRYRFALGVAACLLASALTGASDLVVTARSFFGVYRVHTADDGRFLVLMNGTTLHGVKSLSPGEESQPMAYYNAEGVFGHFFAAIAPNSVKRIAVIGLGTGELGCYAQFGQDWTFYEIDPLIEQIARDPRYFQFLTNCGNSPQVVLGDARITVANAPDGAYDELIIDAFSSDSIPMHLLTREALSLYLRKIAPGGLILFHISSRTLDLVPVLGALAADAGVQGRVLFDQPPAGTPIWRRAPALAVVLAGPGGDLSRFNSADSTRSLPPADPQSLWTDQRSDLLRAIRIWR